MSLPETPRPTPDPDELCQCGHARKFHNSEAGCWEGPITDPEICLCSWFAEQVPA